MCVLAFAWQAHPRWLLVSAGNRDEMHSRPAAPMAAWDAPSRIMAGRDLLSGGTWMGVSAGGRFAVVTNLRGYGTAQPDRASRGALVSDWLEGEGRYADPQLTDLADFNPFNLIVADGAQAHFLTNRPDAFATPLAHGVYGLSNGRLDEPWPKTMHLKGCMTDWLASGADDPAALFAGLAMDRLPEAGLPSLAPSDVPEEAAQSPVFIRNAVYGTRCSTVVAIDRQGQGMVIERRFSPEGGQTGETRLSFSWQS